MPLYDYKCSKCGIVREIHINLGEETQPICCDTNMERVWTVPGVQFKGPGFYSTGG